MTRNWRQRACFLVSISAGAIACILTFAAGYQLGHVQGWNDAKRVARGDAAYDALPQHGWWGWPTAFPDDDKRMR
jgi:hypothetical protein